MDTGLQGSYYFRHSDENRNPVSFFNQSNATEFRV
jgi:hypothetical protein